MDCSSNQAPLFEGLKAAAAAKHPAVATAIAVARKAAPTRKSRVAAR
jgi:hypothetical protein